ncbi:hypothetical protein H2200_011896 [Cladophialophora chaetospira]|uniref:Homeobox domain-containing protein n=1 Tax=Cladophialophora chaetospira TaxID=386627 RepID=A0AA39CCY4_9EURO|nr:hypothetical protein H2200_011896 [Cladophialophora chaetospira]
MDAGPPKTWNNFDDLFLNIGPELENLFDSDFPASTTDELVFPPRHFEEGTNNSRDLVCGPTSYSPLTELSPRVQAFQQPFQSSLNVTNAAQLDHKANRDLSPDPFYDILHPVSFWAKEDSAFGTGQELSAAENLRTQKRRRPDHTASSNNNSSGSQRQTKRKKARFTAPQIAILENWLFSNLGNPFPDKEAKASLARSAKLSIRQVQRWFARTRQRKLLPFRRYEAPADLSRDESFTTLADRRATTGPGRGQRSTSSSAKCGAGRRPSTPRSSLENILSKPAFTDGKIPSSCILNHFHPSADDQRGTTIDYAPISEVKSCPSRLGLTGKAEAAKTCHHLSSTNGKSSLEVVHASSPCSLRHICNSHSSGRLDWEWLEWDNVYPDFADEHQTGRPQHESQDWSVENWLQTLPAKPDDLAPAQDIEQETERPPLSGSELGNTVMNERYDDCGTGHDTGRTFFNALCADESRRLPQGRPEKGESGPETRAVLEAFQARFAAVEATISMNVPKVDGTCSTSSGKDAKHPLGLSLSSDGETQKFETLMGAHTSFRKHARRDDDLSLSSDSKVGEATNGTHSSRTHRKRKTQTEPSFADGVLIRFLHPNEVQLAKTVKRNPLESASQSEAEEEDNEAKAEAGRRQMSKDKSTGGGALLLMQLKELQKEKRADTVRLDELAQHMLARARLPWDRARVTYPTGAEKGEKWRMKKWRMSMLPIPVHSPQILQYGKNDKMGTLRNLKEL